MAKQRPKLSESDKELGKLVKRANQRLRQLEKKGLAKNNIYYKSFQNRYNKGASYLGTTRSGEMKYRTDIGKMSSEEKKRLRRNVNLFLDNDWSLSSKAEQLIEDSYTKGYETAKKKYGLNISQEEYYNLWDEMKSETFNKILDSGQKMAIMRYVAPNKSVDEIRTALDEMIKKKESYRDLIRKEFDMTFDENMNPTMKNEEKSYNKKLKNAKMFSKKYKK